MRMRIVSVEPLDKKKSRVLTDEGLAFLLFNGEMEHYGLAEGQEIGRDLYEKLLREVLCPRAKEKLIRLLEASDKTEAELRRRLKDGGCPPEAAEAALDWAREYRYADDRRYAENYVRSAGESKSRRQIEAFLTGKGVDRELIRECLDEAEIDEAGQIRRLLEKRGYCREEADEREQRRTMAFLSRRGFSYEAILDIMHKKD